MKPKQYIRFTIIFILAHLISYLVMGGISYQLFYKPFWEGQNPLFAPFMRTIIEPELWKHTTVWQIPGQILRGLLMSIVLYPVLNKIIELSFIRRYLFIGGLLYIFAHFASSAPSPANIEGFIYMRPEFVNAFFLKGQPEMIMYSLFAGFLISRFMIKKETKDERIFETKQR